MVGASVHACRNKMGGGEGERVHLVRRSRQQDTEEMQLSRRLSSPRFTQGHRKARCSRYRRGRWVKSLRESLWKSSSDCLYSYETGSKILI